MFAQGDEISWLLDCVWCLRLALFEYTAELVVCWFGCKYCGDCLDHDPGDDISFCLHLGAQDEEAKRSERGYHLQRPKGRVSLDKLEVISWPDWTLWYHPKIDFLKPSGLVTRHVR